MILTDREWLRFVTFAMFVGTAFAVAFVSVMILRGHTLTWAFIAGVTGPGLLALIVHVVMRFILDRSTAPIPADAADTEETA